MATPPQPPPNGGSKPPPKPRTRRTSTPAPGTAKAARETKEPEVKGDLEVELPAGGRLRLQNADEVQQWNESKDRYIDDYGLTKANDLMLLGAILSQALAMYRAQQQLADPKKATAAQNTIMKSAGEIRDLEKALGIDKKTREAGGQHTVIDYVTRLKRAAHAKGVHLSERLKKYDAFVMELRWKIRLLRNGDDEDRAHHGITKESILDWAERELNKLEDEDKKFGKTKAAVFVGRL